MKFLQRLGLVLLRRVGPRASSGFRESAINIAADGEITRLLAARERNAFVEIEAGP